MYWDLKKIQSGDTIDIPDSDAILYAYIGYCMYSIHCTWGVRELGAVFRKQPPAPERAVSR